MYLSINFCITKQNYNIDDNKLIAIIALLKT